MDISIGLLQRALDHEGGINKIGVVLTKVPPDREQLSRSHEVPLYSFIILRANLRDSEEHALLHFVRWASANIQAPDIRGTPFP